MPIQTLSGTISPLIFQFTRLIMFLTPTPRPISLRWSFPLNSSLQKYLTHSVTHRNHKRKTFASRTIQRFPIQIAANYVHIQRLTWGLSFASTPSPCLYADDLQDSFVGIAAARLLPRAQLNALIQELTQAFATRYEEPPSARDLQALDDALEAHVPESVVTNLPAFNYRKRLDDLAAPSWLVGTFRRYLDADPWPPSDKARGQRIGIGCSKKRVREQEKLEVRIPGTKSQRRSDGRECLSTGESNLLNGQLFPSYPFFLPSLRTFMMRLLCNIYFAVRGSNSL